MKAVEQPEDLASAEDRDAALADRLLQESGYLPSQDDQSWREQAALHIAPGLERDGTDEPADWDSVEPQPMAETHPERSGRGGVLVAFLMIAVIVPVIAALTFPDILTAGFWRAQRSTAHGASAPPPSVATPLRAALPEPASSRLPPPAQATPAAPPRPAPEAAPADTNVPIIDARKPAPRSLSPHAPEHEMAQEDRTGGFYAKVPGPDGVLRSQYFPADPSARPTAAENAGKDRDAGGFYAMVAAPDGTLRYKYFSSKPSQRDASDLDAMAPR